MDTTNIGKSKKKLEPPPPEPDPPPQTMPTHLSAAAAAHLFGDEEVEPARAWQTEDAAAFETVFAALKVIERDAEAVAEAGDAPISRSSLTPCSGKAETDSMAAETTVQHFPDGSEIHTMPNGGTITARWVKMDE